MIGHFSFSKQGTFLNRALSFFSINTGGGHAPSVFMLCLQRPSLRNLMKLLLKRCPFGKQSLTSKNAPFDKSKCPIVHFLIFKNNCSKKTFILIHKTKWVNFMLFFRGGGSKMHLQFSMKKCPSSVVPPHFFERSYTTVKSILTGIDPIKLGPLT